MRTYRIHLLRHGKTEANSAGRFIGQTDIPLSPEGEEQLRQLRKEREYPAVQRVYTSPLVRCVRTAEILYPGFEPAVVDSLQEYNFGAYENKTAAELVEDEAFMAWLRGGPAAETMENMHDFEARLIDGFEQVLKDMMAKRLSSAAVITHGGVIMTLLAALGLPKRDPKLWITDNGHGYTVATSAQLWSQGRLVEVFDRLPYEEYENESMDNDTLKEYNLIDLVAEDGAPEETE